MQGMQEMEIHPWVRKIPLEEGKATHSSILFSGKSYRQRNLVGCSPWGHKESDTTEWLSTRLVFNVQKGLELEKKQTKRKTGGKRKLGSDCNYPEVRWQGISLKQWFLFIKQKNSAQNLLLKTQKRERVLAVCNSFINVYYLLMRRLLSISSASTTLTHHHMPKWIMKLFLLKFLPYINFYLR